MTIDEFQQKDVAYLVTTLPVMCIPAGQVVRPCRDGWYFWNEGYAITFSERFPFLFPECFRIVTRQEAQSAWVKKQDDLIKQKADKAGVPVELVHAALDQLRTLSRLET